MPEPEPNPAEAVEPSDSATPRVEVEASSVAPQETPMIDVYPPHETVHTWKDFFIHIATIVVGLVIAIGLEQSVEWVHHNHQRHQLQDDLRNEAKQNLQVIDRDLEMRQLEPWFEQALQPAVPAAGHADKVQLTLPPPPCVQGSVGTAKVRYFAPSQAVWTAAAASDLVELLPVEQSRLQARLAHNYQLLGNVRDQVANGCNAVIAMRRRFAQPDPSHSTADLWTMTPAQAEALAGTASSTETAIQALLFRLRWSKVYEQGIVDGDNDPDIKMMTMDESVFEDPSAW